MGLRSKSLKVESLFWLWPEIWGSKKSQRDATLLALMMKRGDKKIILSLKAEKAKNGHFLRTSK